MIHCRISLLLLALFLVLSTVPAQAAPAPLSGKRVLFLGDSITQDGTYVSFVEYYLNKRYPKEKFDFISIGLASETTSGLSEKAHPFPRPCVHERLSRALKATNPSIVVACYGMNDGIYHPQSPERMKAFQAGIKTLIAKCKSAGARIILLTPPPFDPAPVQSKTLPATAPDFSYMSPYARYDSVLVDYGKWEKTLPHKTAQVIDIHTPLAAYTSAQRRTNPNFLLNGDGIHPSQEGHLQIAAAILNAIGVPLHVTDATLNQATGDPLYQLVARHRQTRSEGWLPYVGYTRDGTFKTNSITDTEQKAVALQTEIDHLRRAPTAHTP